MERILLVEDDLSLGKSLNDYLKMEHFAVHWVKGVQEANDVLKNEKFDLLILDWMLKDGEGIELLKELRKSGKHTPIIMLTARNELIDKVIGLESGANDYLTKPFEPRELLARVRAQLNASKSFSEKNDLKSEILRKDLRIDLVNREVVYKGELVTFTKMEFDFLVLLAEIPGRPFSRDEILNKVWGFEHFPTTRTVDTHVLQLRQKLSDDMIETVRGIGYRFSKTFQ